MFKKYTLPTITTVLSSAASYFIASAEDAAGEVETSKQQAATDARQNFLDNMESLFDDILADKTDVKARTYIPAGTRIIVYPNTDLWLRTVERDEEESNKMVKPEIFLDDTSPSLKTDAEKKRELARNSEGVEAGSSVVYDPEEVDAQSVSESPSVFIDDTAGKKKNKNLVPPPPPNSGSFGAPSSAPVASTPSSASTSSTSADSTSSSGIPALF